MNIAIIFGLFVFILLCGKLIDQKADQSTEYFIDDGIMNASYTEIQTIDEP